MSATEYYPDAPVFTAPLSPEVSKGISQVLTCMGSPSSIPQLTRVLSAANAAIHAVIRVNPNLFECMEKHLKCVQSALRDLETQPPTGGLLSAPNASTTIRFFMSDLHNVHPKILEIAGNLLISALLQEKQVEDGPMRKLLTLHRSVRKNPALSTEQLHERDRLLQKSAEQLQMLSTLRSQAGSDDAFRVDAKLLTHLRATIYSEHPKQQKAADLRHLYGADQLRSRIEELLEECSSGNWCSFTLLVAIATGLPWTIAIGARLKHGSHQPTGMFWLDVEQGLLAVKLPLVLSALGERTAGSHPTADVLRLQLPDKIAMLLRQATALYPKASKLGELHLQKYPDAISTLDAIADRATLIRSMGVHAARLSNQRATAAYAFLAFELLTSSDLHYITLSEQGIWNLRSQVFEELGLGSCVQPDEICHYLGSKRTPTTESVIAIFDELKAAVAASTVARRSSLLALVAFHNAYVRYVAMFLHFAAGARRVRVLRFRAHSWFSGSIFGYLDDKDAGISGGRTAIHICPMTTLQLAFWEVHLNSLSRRLQTLLRTGDTEARKRITSILGRSDVSLLFLLTADGTPKDLTTDDVFIGCSSAMNRDLGRHFFATELVRLGVSLADIQGFLRHQGGHANPQSALGAAIHRDRLHRLSTACEAVMTSIGIHAIPGLSKGVK